VNVLTFEEGTPDSKFTGSVDWSMGAFGATFRATRYGEVLVPGTTAASDFVLSPKVLLDLEARVNFNEQWRLAVGAENLTDEYPDALTINLNTTGNTPYSNYSPFGRSGRLLYVRLNYDF
jgi:iron complex outermembrane receptor protein